MKREIQILFINAVFNFPILRCINIRLKINYNCYPFVIMISNKRFVSALIKRCFKPFLHYLLHIMQNLYDNSSYMLDSYPERRKIISIKKMRKRYRRKGMLIKNGMIHTMSHQGTIYADIRLYQGKITEVKDNLQPLADEKVIDASGKQIFPGMVEAHCHLGLEESAIRMEGADINETSDPITPHMRAIDGCNPLDETITNACKAGVTTVAAGPGSANVIGGTFMAYKTHGICIDEMVMKNPVAMKCAFGENPKRVYNDTHIKTRMNIAGLLRETLLKTKEYADKKEAANGDVLKMPAYDMKLEAMIPVIRKELPMKCHAHRADDILTVLRIAKEFDINITLDHCTDGEIIKKQVKASGFPAIVGPSLTHKTKFELANKSFKTPKVLQEEGVLIAITTDSPVIPQEYLPLCAALAMKEGLEEIEALKAITINPAKILGLEDRVGSIEEGKDGDMIICSSFILDTQNVVDYTIINGKIAYQKD